MNFENLLFEQIDAVGIIKINRPEVRNALDTTTLNEIHHALDELRHNNEIKVLVITGAGEKAFIAGADIAKLRELKFKDAFLPGLKALCTEIEEFEKPVIAAINGFALGGGTELALACDIRVASVNAKFGLPELNLGLIPGAGGTQRMTRLVGKGKAKELIFTGDIISAEEAERIGLINKVVPTEDLISSTLEMAGKMIQKGPIALLLAKIAINAGAETDLKTGLLIERLSASIIFTTEDKYEGTTSFLEKRSANFKGN